MKRILVILFLSAFICAPAIATPAQDFIDALNELRSETDPSAANMRRVEFNNCLARVARRYAQTCPALETHNPDRNTQAVTAGCVPEGTTIGETIIFRDTEIRDPVETLSIGKSSYNYNDNTCSALCDDYLQLINAETYAVGCHRRDEASCGREGYTLICNYANAPVLTQRPYVEGAVCSQCPADQPSCDSDGLCVQLEATTPTSPVTKPSPECPKDHDHKDKHNHDHKHGPHGHKDKYSSLNGDAENDKNDGQNHGKHDHQNGHKQHDHNHGASHDHVHENDNDNGNSMAHIQEALAASDATSITIMGSLMILSTLIILIL